MLKLKQGEYLKPLDFTTITFIQILPQEINYISRIRG